MKKLLRNIKKEQGFTLLEVIVTITVAAVMFSVVIAFMGTAITKSADPVKQARDLGNVSGVAETIYSSYACYLKKNYHACENPNVCQVCPAGCANCSGCEWSTFKTAVACLGGTVSVVGDGNGLYNPNFETIQVTTTNGGQKLVSYFMSVENEGE